MTRKIQPVPRNHCIVLSARFNGNKVVEHSVALPQIRLIATSKPLRVAGLVSITLERNNLHPHGVKQGDIITLMSRETRMPCSVPSPPFSPDKCHQVGTTHGQ